MNEPRQYSIVKFDYDEIPKEYHEAYPFDNNESLIYFGEIPNMPGHCVVMDIKSGEMIAGYHIENFKEVSEDET